MSRHYHCSVCGYQKETKALRGPVPLKCDECKAKEPRKVAQKTIDTRKVDRRSIESMNKVQRAMELRRDYKTWDYIAREVGYLSPEAAHSACKIEMRRRSEQLNETIDDYREKELARLEMAGAEVIKVLRNKHLIVNSGQVVIHNDEELVDDGPVLAAVDRLVKVSESIRKLLGADSAVKTEAQVNVNYTVEGIIESEMP